MDLESPSLPPELTESKKRVAPLALIVGGILLLFLGVFVFFLPPFGLGVKDGIYLNIKEGMSARQIANTLKENNIIRSSGAFLSLVYLFNDEKSLSPGVYLFRRPLSVFEAERRIDSGDYGILLKKITFPEGFTNIQIANRLEANLPKFDKNQFLALASTSEGYLYPETYFFLPSDTPSVILKKLTDTFNEKTKAINSNVQNDRLSSKDIIIMASILEREVKTKEDKQIVSGILWNRMRIGMPLQVDATLAYERDKDSYTLTTEDLRRDSPYNTYTRKGLPPTPISNPGFDSIYAAIYPTENKYIYFLTDREGNVYYARTYEEHLRNKAKHI